MDWETSHNKEGSIFKIKRTKDIASSFFRIELEDDYDIVGNDQGNWLSCDPDFSLAGYGNYLTGKFQQASSCEGNSRAKCIKVFRGQQTNDFLCDSVGEREAIFECSTSTIAPASELEKNDDYGAYLQGEIIPSPVSIKKSTFNRVNSCSGDKVFCTQLLSAYPNSFIEIKDFEVTNWFSYDYFEFNIFVENRSKLDSLYLEIYDSSSLGPVIFSDLNQSIISEKKDLNGIWYKIRVLTGNPFWPISNIKSMKINPRVANIGEVKLEDFHFFGRNTYYCSRDLIGANYSSKWIQDLDNDVVQGAACDAGRFTDWTGTRCCGDDTRSNFFETYNDTGGLCFLSKAYLTKTKTVHLIDLPENLKTPQNQFPLLINGTTVYSCGFGMSAIPSTNNVGGLSPSSLPFVQVSACTVFTDQSTGESYFCSENGWSNSSYTYLSQGSPITVLSRERTQQSFDISNSSYSCCSANTCWNGTTCASPDPAIYATPTVGATQLQCFNGKWLNASLSFDWLNEEYESCPESSQCLLDKDAPLSGSSNLSLQEVSRCKPNGWYSLKTKISGVSKSSPDYSSVSDLYCDNSNWTSRTKFIAEKILEVPQSRAISDYSISCGSVEKVLVSDSLGKAYKSFYDNANSPLSFTNSYDTEYFNNICILSYEEFGAKKIVIGGSYNPLRTKTSTGTIELRTLLSESFDINDLNFASCSSSSNTRDFMQCSGLRLGSASSGISNAANSRFYWNNQTQSFIYTPNGDDIWSTSTINRLYNVLVTPILNILGIVQLPVPLTRPIALKDARLLNDFYISVSGNKKILFFIEPKIDTDNKIKEFFSVHMENFDADVCGSVDVYDNKRIPSSFKTMICHRDNASKTTTIFGSIDRSKTSDVAPQEEFLKIISRSTRLK